MLSSVTSFFIVGYKLGSSFCVLFSSERSAVSQERMLAGNSTRWCCWQSSVSKVKSSMQAFPSPSLSETIQCLATGGVLLRPFWGWCKPRQCSQPSSTGVGGKRQHKCCSLPWADQVRVKETAVISFLTWQGRWWRMQERWAGSLGGLIMFSLNSWGCP